MTSLASNASRPGLLSRVPSPAVVVGAITSVQFGSAIAATLFARIGPGGAVLLRLVCASVVLLAVWRPQRGAVSRRGWLLAVVFGVVLATMNLAFYNAVDRIPLGVAVTIEFVGPLAVAVAGSRRALDLVWVALAAAGILALMHGGAHGLNAVGVGFALAAGALWGTYILLSARMGQVFEDGHGLTVAMCVATIVALPAGISDGGVHLLSTHALVLGAAVGVLSSAIPYSFEMEALRRIATNVFGVLMSLEPAIAAVAGLIVLGQALSARELIGIALVVAASVGASLRARRAPVEVL